MMPNVICEVNSRKIPFLESFIFNAFLANPSKSHQYPYGKIRRTSDEKAVKAASFTFLTFFPSDNVSYIDVCSASEAHTKTCSRENLMVSNDTKNVPKKPELAKKLSLKPIARVTPSLKSLACSWYHQFRNANVINTRSTFGETIQDSDKTK